MACTLGFWKIEKIRLEDLVSKRDLQKDIHFTLWQNGNGSPTKESNPAYPVILSNRIITVVEPYSFIINDNKYTYYFPRNPQAEIKQEPIPSGIFVPDLEEQNLQRSLAEIISRNAWYTMIESIYTGRTERREIEGRYTLLQAIECGNEQAIKAVGKVEIPFDKPLCRVRNFGRYPHLPEFFDTRKWQEFGELTTKHHNLRAKPTQ